MQVLWFDEPVLKRLRVEYQDILRGVTAASVTGSIATSFDSPKELQSQLEVAAILRDATRTLARDLLPLVERSAETGFFVAPLAVTDGMLRFSYDERQLLQAAVQIAAPFAALEKKLKPSLDQAQSALATPNAFTEAAVRNLTRELFQQFSAHVRGVDQGYLGFETERLLLDRRAYKRRCFLDAEWLRAELVAQAGATPVPTYVPASLCQRLPLLGSFRARMIVEVLPRQDYREQHPLATRVVALARLLSFQSSPS